MRTFINILIILSLITSCKSKKAELNTTEFQTYKRINSKNTWGFINQNGDTIIPLNVYKFLNPIDDKNMIFAQLKDGKYGFINIHQDTLISFKYDNMGVFDQGQLAPANFKGKYGYINRKGEVKIPFQYENKSYFYNSGLAIAKKEGKFGFINMKGEEIVPIEFESVKQSMYDTIVLASKNSKWAFYSKKGTRKTDFKYDEVVETYIEIDGRTKSTLFGNGLVLVKAENKTAYINNDLEEIVPFGTYEIAKPFQNDLGIVSNNRKYGIINTQGEIVIPITNDFIEHPSEYSNNSELIAIRKGNIIQLLDKTAKPITDFDIKEYKWDSYKSKESYQRYFILTKNSGMTGTVSDKGIMEIPFEYEEIEPFNGRSVTFAKLNGKYGLIDYLGNVKYPFEFDEVISSSYSDYFIVNKSGNYGMINKNGKQIISFAYENITPTFYGKSQNYIIQKNGLYGIIDIEKNIIIPIEYEEISNWVEYGPKEHFVTKNGKKGLISRDGEIVIPTQYDEIFVDNSKLIKVKNDGLYGTVDWGNKTIHPIKYEQILWEWPYLTQKQLDTIYIKENGKYFSTDTDGKVIELNVSKKLIDKKFGYLVKNE
ncbi:WG repeat-containing protein [uncultured Dokdonia sp.]|uniref:WG repeat-containing protein n=1 Tax=uncultured Dokdonia sp. TaxID=575653 RepID=UPI00261B731B|nr:WG repeat-containing protein [uncultured Dokdonia sp.]